LDEAAPFPRGRDAGDHGFLRGECTGSPIPQLKRTIDLSFAREPVSGNRNAKPYEIFDGQKLVPIRDYLRAHPRPDLIRLEERMNGLSAGPYGNRAGEYRNRRQLTEKLSGGLPLSRSPSLQRAKTNHFSLPFVEQA
jgi:hypothetical protein